VTSTLRAQLARSRQAQAGSKRIEAVLNEKAVQNLAEIKAALSLTTTEAVTEALAVMAGKVPNSIPIRTGK
jgi:SOS response regulatory protein OraA/RecX